MSVGETLAGRLGHAPDSRYLIVNCDDLGSSHSANAASLKAMEAGVATSATLMVPCPWAREAVRMFQGRDLGVHLTLTCEYPDYRWRSLIGASSLHDHDGFLPAAVKDVFANAKPEDVRTELRAQIEQAMAWGVDITHLDSHMGTAHLHKPFFLIYVDLAAEYRLPLRFLGMENSLLNFDAQKHAAERGVLVSDHFIDCWAKDTRTFLRERVSALPSGVSDACTHPVVDGDELRSYDPDAPDQRANDAICLSDPALAQFIRSSRAIPISYRPIRELQRSLG